MGRGLTLDRPCAFGRPIRHARRRDFDVVIDMKRGKAVARSTDAISPATGSAGTDVAIPRRVFPRGFKSRCVEPTIRSVIVTIGDFAAARMPRSNAAYGAFARRLSYIRRDPCRIWRPLTADGRALSTGPHLAWSPPRPCSRSYARHGNHKIEGGRLLCPPGTCCLYFARGRDG
jgi:hypothetical protein